MVGLWSPGHVQACASVLCLSVALEAFELHRDKTFRLMKVVSMDSVRVHDPRNPESSKMTACPHALIWFTQFRNVPCLKLPARNLNVTFQSKVVRSNPKSFGRNLAVMFPPQYFNVWLAVLLMCQKYFFSYSSSWPAVPFSLWRSGTVDWILVYTLLSNLWLWLIEAVVWGQTAWLLTHLSGWVRLRT